MPTINSINISSGKLRINIVGTPKPPLVKEKRRHQVLRLLYSPQCGHCTKLMPVWDEFIKKNPNLYTYEKIDCYQNNELCRNHKIKGVPAVYKAIGGDIYDSVIGSMDFESFNKFAMADIVLSKKMTLPKIVPPELPKPSKPEPLVQKSGELKKIVLVATPHCGFCAKFTPVWDEASIKYNDKFKFERLDCSANECTDYTYQGVPTIFVKDGDTIIDTSVGYKDLNGFEEILNKHIDDDDVKVPANDVTVPGYQIILGYTEQCPFCIKFMPVWDKMDTKYDIKFTKLNCATGQCSDYTIEGVPSIFIKLDGKEIAKTDGYQDETVFEKFITENIQGDKLKLKEDPTKISEKRELVRQSSRDKFDNTFDENLDSVVLVYMPTCGFCKRFIPIWDKSVTHFVGKYNFIKLNCTEGECKGYDFEGVPTIFIKDSSKNTLDTSVGFKEFDEFSKFLNKNLKEKKTLKEEVKPAIVEEVKPVVVEEVKPVEVKENNIEPSIVKTKIKIAMMYSPYCGFCKKLLPYWDKLTAKHEDTFIFEKNDCTESDICTINKVEGVPTIIKSQGDTIISKSVGYKEFDELEKFILEKISIIIK